MDLYVDQPVIVEFRGVPLTAVPARARGLNLSGPPSGPTRACSRHPLRTVGPDGCPGCWEQFLGRAA